MRWRFLAASVWATETDSTKPMIEIRTAGPISSPTDRARRTAWSAAAGPAARRRQSDACGFTEKAQAMKVVTTTAPPARPWQHVGQLAASCPVDSSSGFSPLRTQNRKAVALTPIKRDPVDLAQMLEQRLQHSSAGCGRRRKRREHVRSWLGDDHARGGDEAGDHRMARGNWRESPAGRPRAGSGSARQEGQRDAASSSSGDPARRCCRSRRRSSARPPPRAPRPAPGWCRRSRRARSARSRRRSRFRRQAGQQRIGQRLRDQHDGDDHGRNRSLPSASRS
jgi:hypothetical protein